MSDTAAYSYSTLSAAMLKLNPAGRDAAIDRGAISSEWAKSGATNKDLRASVFQTFLEDGKIFAGPNPGTLRLPDADGNMPRGAVPCHPFIPSQLYKSLGPEKAGAAMLELADKKGFAKIAEGHPAAGLRVKFIKKNDDPSSLSPGPDTAGLYHYHGTLANGDVFDSSYARGKPTKFAPSEVIASWREVLQLTCAGDKIIIVSPAAIAYGERGHPPAIPGNSVLCFTIEAIAVGKEGSKPGSEARAALEKLLH